MLACDFRYWPIASFWSSTDYFRSLETDIVRAGRHVSKVPISDIDHGWRLSQRGS